MSASTHSNSGVDDNMAGPSSGSLVAAMDDQGRDQPGAADEIERAYSASQLNDSVPDIEQKLRNRAEQSGSSVNEKSDNIWSYFDSMEFHKLASSVQESYSNISESASKSIALDYRLLIGVIFHSINSRASWKISDKQQYRFPPMLLNTVDLLAKSLSEKGGDLPDSYEAFIQAKRNFVHKGDGVYVTSVDLKIMEAFVRYLMDEYPSYLNGNCGDDLILGHLIDHVNYLRDQLANFNEQLEDAQNENFSQFAKIQNLESRAREAKKEAGEAKKEVRAAKHQAEDLKATNRDQLQKINRLDTQYNQQKRDNLELKSRERNHQSALEAMNQSSRASDEMKLAAERLGVKKDEIIKKLENKIETMAQDFKDLKKSAKQNETQAKQTIEGMQEEINAINDDRHELNNQIRALQIQPPPAAVVDELVALRKIVADQQKHINGVTSKFRRLKKEQKASDKKNSGEAVAQDKQ